MHTIVWIYCNVGSRKQIIVQFPPLEWGKMRFWLLSEADIRASDFQNWTESFNRCEIKQIFVHSRMIKQIIVRVVIYATNGESYIPGR